MMRNTILRSSAAMASTSFARPAVRARPVIAAARTMGAGAGVSKRGYHAKVIDHYENPRNVGNLPKGDFDVGTGLVGAPACGDVMKLQIRVGEDGVISEVKFKTFGCGSAIASSSYMTERVKGMTLDQAGAVKNTEIAKELCLPPVKLHCSLLAEDAIKSAIKDYQTKRAQRLASANAANATLASSSSQPQQATA
ncbi:iron sulfur cluster assembly protein 1, mitochondrial [Cryptococcus neoformans]|nr:iron sulfur cluster assembly protein 2, mitochondrial [Cryptococcus neoformans var. grubii c45]OXB38769.1 iron sulfur cluster assembly protein 2, mitochondrial [Cryptococcus neoformans var. grubii]OXC63394.1 iron sulfur cluster assembly protein 2, mitochondrial [Cryptococcus neoformans var. grubii MW-RSA852]UOH81225.1 iron sulfur cluster assembly protein 1, mitochondrial [Cryptococcus neoformans]